MSRAEHPPLSVVLVAVAVALAVLTLLANLHRLGLNETDTLNLERLSTPSADDRPTIVALGTSKTRKGIYFDGAMTEALAAEGIKADFYRISWSSATIEELQPALAYLASTPPELLLLESDLLIFRPWRQERGFQWHATLVDNVRALKRLTGMGTVSGQNYGFEQPYAEAFCEQKKSPSSLQDYQNRASARRVSSPDERAAYLEYLAPMIAQGTDVVLLELPRSPAANAVFPPELRTEANRLRADFAAREGFANWAPPPLLLPEPLYCDQGHLLENGRDQFSRWLAGKIAQESSWPGSSAGG